LKAEIIGIIIATITAFCTAIAGAIVKHLQKKYDARAAEKERQANELKDQYEKLLKDDQIRTQRKMILEELDPFIVELTHIKQDLSSNIKEVKAHIEKDEKEFEKEINKVKEHHDLDKEEVDDQIKELTIKHENNLARIIESYKFRFIQLCKTHLRENYISEEDLTQIITFYDLYHGLGGNGQAEEYYEMVKQLPKVKPAE
jgi:phenylalanyl-tRNA synthetase alpha subunit